MAPVTLSVYQPITQPNSSIECVVDDIETYAYLAAQTTPRSHLLLLPEAFLGGYPRGSSFDAVVGSRTPAGRAQYASYAAGAVDLGSKMTPGDGTKERLETIANSHNLFIVVGCVERVGGTLYCAVLFVDPQRGLIGKRRKLIPTATERVIWSHTHTSNIPAITTTLNGVQMTLAAAICWENYMPLLRYTLYAQNTQIYLAPTADGRESWTSTMRHIAMEGRCFVLSANSFVPPEEKKEAAAGSSGQVADQQGRTSCRGGSVIVGPLGDILAGPLWDKEGMLTVTIKDLPDEILQAKMDFDVVGHYKGPWKVVPDHT
ncbi:carbon-nitrogen hydrolase [Kalaharituber pfeilii]|nr:carbon-nitrogen hydrolase [Kalaharituber pfeilii]